MPRLLIVPTFSGSLMDSAAELSDFFFLRAKSAVPVESFTITVDGHCTEFLVESGHYDTALFLLYCAVLADRKTSYSFSPHFQGRTPGYYGDGILIDAARKETKYRAVHLLLGREVTVELTLRSGYDLPQDKGRTEHELIEFGWHIRDELGSERPAPLLRAALGSFLEAVRLNTVTIIDNENPNQWPSRLWVKRAGMLSRELGMMTAVPA